MHEKVFSQKKIKTILGFSKAIGVLSPPYILLDKFECSVHIYKGPWFTGAYRIFDGE